MYQYIHVCVKSAGSGKGGGGGWLGEGKNVAILLSIFTVVLT